MTKSIANHVNPKVRQSGQFIEVYEINATTN